MVCPTVSRPLDLEALVHLAAARKAGMTSRVSTRPATASRCLSYRGKRVHKRVSWRQPEAHRIDNISWTRGREREREGERNMPGNRAVARDFIASNEHFGD